MRDISELAQKAAAQHGLLTLTQLREQGWTRRSVGRLLQRGYLERRSRGIVVLAGASPSREQEVMRVCMASSPWADASHRTALGFWGLRDIDDIIEVSVRYPRNYRSPVATVHRSRDLCASDRTWIEGVPVTTPVRSLCDAGLVLGEDVVRGLVQHSMALGLVTPRELLAYRRRVGRQGRTGVRYIDLALDGVTNDLAEAESGPEVQLRRLLRKAGVPAGSPQHMVVAGGSRYRIDLAFPDERLAIEFDGYAAHVAPASFVGDRRRQNALLLAGWTVLRFSGDDLRHRPSSVVREVQRALAAATPVL